MEQLDSGELLGYSADGIKLRKGMRVWYFSLEVLTPIVDCGIIKFEKEIPSNGTFSGKYVNKKVCEYMQKKHFKIKKAGFCDKGWHDGDCCCNCKWRRYDGKYTCVHPISSTMDISEHGMCEMHDINEELTTKD